jgi:hypothetical protein
MVFGKLARAFGRDVDYKKYNEIIRGRSVPETDLYSIIEFEIRFVNGTIGTREIRGLELPFASMVLDVARVDGTAVPSKLEFPGSWGIQVGDRVKAYIDISCCCQSEVNSKGEYTNVEHHIARELKESETPYKLELIREGHVVGKFVDDYLCKEGGEFNTDCDEHGYKFPE